MFYFALILLIIFLVVYALIRRICDPRGVGGIESFLGAPSVSTPEDVSGGASGLYGWGKPPSIPPAPLPIPPAPPVPVQKYKKVYTCTKRDCYNCDITRNKDINKYILKSSVPPCPDLSKYILKSEACPCGPLDRQPFPPPASQRSITIPGRIEDHPDFPQYMRRSDCASYQFTPMDDFFSWLNFGKWYEGRNKDSSDQMLKTISKAKGKVLPYNAIGEIV